MILAWMTVKADGCCLLLVMRDTIIGNQKNKFFVMLDGGFLLNFEDFDENTRYFLNPGLGISIPLTRSTLLSFAAGLFTQYDYNFFGRIPDGGIRDSFINMRLGLVFGK